VAILHRLGIPSLSYFIASRTMPRTFHYRILSKAPREGLQRAKDPVYQNTNHKSSLGQRTPQNMPVVKAQSVYWNSNFHPNTHRRQILRSLLATHMPCSGFQMKKVSVMDLSDALHARWETESALSVTTRTRAVKNMGITLVLVPNCQSE
jgi:hypothetical protein